MINVIIVGFNGQMGKAIAELIYERSETFTLVAGVDKVSEPNSRGIPVYGSIFEVEQAADVVIDFSRPESLAGVLAYCKLKGMRPVIGTTGLSPDDISLIDRYSSDVPIFWTRNMSLGVNLQMELIKQTAATLGEAFEVEIIEKHHNLKVDSPSGTALMLAESVATQFPVPRKYVYGRYSKSERRKPNEIGFHSVRGGTLVGEHEVMFIGKDEVIEISHRAYSKRVFAVGALRAAEFMMNKLPGIYSMRDVIMEKNVLTHLYTVEDQAVITLANLPHVSGIMSEVFDVIAKRSIPVDMISTITRPGVGDVSFSIGGSYLSDAMEALTVIKDKYEGSTLDATTGLTKLTVEGVGMEFTHGVAAKIFDVFAEAKINIMLVTTSETKIAYCIENSQVGEAIHTMAEKLNL